METFTVMVIDTIPFNKEQEVTKYYEVQLPEYFTEDTPKINQEMYRWRIEKLYKDITKAKLVSGKFDKTENQFNSSK